MRGSARKVEVMQDDRWEYRIWPAAGAAMVERVIALLGDRTRVDDRTDTYFITPATEILAKMRGDEAFEIKLLLQARDGCERWTKEVRQPLNGSRKLEEMMGPQIEARSARTLLHSVRRGMSVVEVKKLRQIFRVGPAQVEATYLRVAGEPFETLALEAPQFELCTELAETLGFKDHDNLNYGAALRRHPVR